MNEWMSEGRKNCPHWCFSNFSACQNHLENLFRQVKVVGPQAPSFWIRRLRRGPEIPFLTSQRLLVHRPYFESHWFTQWLSSCCHTQKWEKTQREVFPGNTHLDQEINDISPLWIAFSFQKYLDRSCWSLARLWHHEPILQMKKQGSKGSQSIALGSTADKIRS